MLNIRSRLVSLAVSIDRYVPTPVRLLTPRLLCIYEAVVGPLFEYGSTGGIKTTIQVREFIKKTFLKSYILRQKQNTYSVIIDVLIKHTSILSGRKKLYITDFCSVWVWLVKVLTAGTS